MADLLDETTRDTVVGGVRQIEHVRIYQVFASSTSVGSATVLNASGVPVYGSVLLYDSIPVYCLERDAKRSDTDVERLKWIVTCRFSNNTQGHMRDYLGRPVLEPENSAPQVDITFFESKERFNNAVFLGMEDENGVPVGVSLAPLTLNDYGPVINSAFDYLDAERRAFDKVITYWKYVTEYNNDWEDLIGTINANTVTVTQSDQAGVKLTQSFDARTLLLSSIFKQDYWADGNLYFRIGFQMLKARSPWVVKLLDQGTRQRIFTGQYKLDGTTVTFAERARVTSFDYFLQEIPTFDEDGNQVGLVGQPVPLNGTGMPIPVKQYGTNSATNGKAYYLKYQEFDEANWTALGLS